MKAWLMALGFLLTTVSVANSRDSKTTMFAGAGVASFDLKADKTHTEYRQVVEPRTCYRRVLAGYQTQCNPSGQCYQVPVYRTMPYTCYVTVSVPYEVYDYTVEAKVTLNFNDSNETRAFSVKTELSGDKLSYTAMGLNDKIIERKEVNLTTTIVGPQLRTVDAVSDIVLTPVAPYASALKMTSASVKKSVLTYSLGANQDLRIKHQLKLAKDPLVGSSTTLYNDILSSNVLARQDEGEMVQYQVAFKDLIGRVLGNGRYSVDISADFDGEVLNDRELGGLRTSKSILYKISK